MPDIYQLAAQFRRDLLAEERTAASAMVQAYGQVYVRIQAEARAVLDAIDQAERSGDALGGLTSRARRIEALRVQVLAEIHTFAAFAEQSIIDQQRLAAGYAGDHARQLVLAGLGDPPPGVIAVFHALPTSAVEHLVGTLQDGSPLRTLLDTLGPETAQAVAQALTTGLALGKGPGSISREIRRQAGASLTRALVISRTETMRSYRAASLATYADNEDVVTGWRWTASRSARTCAMCLGMDGKVFSNDVPFGSHPCCRCVPVPVTRTWAEMGYNVPEPVVTPREGNDRETGAEWFARQDAATQEAILGPGKLALYQKGKLKLSDLVDYHDDPRWGPTRREKPMKDL